MSTRRPGGPTIDMDALARYLAAHINGFEGPFTLDKFEGGQSNPTYRLSAASGDYVLRSRPIGDLLASAHAIDREYRLLTAVAGQGAPTPKALHYCDDTTVIGSAFYVMEYVPGRVLTDPLLPGLAPAERAQVYDSMNDALARIHRLDWAAVGLADYGRPENYMARQIARWSRQYEASPAGNMPAMQNLKDWLIANTPEDEPATIAHGDYRLGNLILHPTEPRVVAILDWELSTLGAPMSDLAYNCMIYHLPTGHPLAPGVAGADLGALGIPSEAEYLDAYLSRMGRTGRSGRLDWTFYMAFSLYRTAAIQHGVYVRFLNGNAVSPLAGAFGEASRMVAERGWELASRG